MSVAFLFSDTFFSLPTVARLFLAYYPCLEISKTYARSFFLRPFPRAAALTQQKLGRFIDQFTTTCCLERSPTGPYLWSIQCLRFDNNIEVIVLEVTYYLLLHVFLFFYVINFWSQFLFVNVGCRYRNSEYYNTAHRNANLKKINLQALSIASSRRQTLGNPHIHPVKGNINLLLKLIFICIVCCFFVFVLYLVSIKDVKHFLQSTILYGVSFSLFITEESTTQGSKVGQRHQTVTATTNA